jgi:DNA-binding transcriptional LysR family regulator
LLSLAEIVSVTDYLATLPALIAEFFCELWPLKRYPLPLDFDPGPLLMCWHPRFDADPAHLFFRDVLRSTLASLVADGEVSFGHSAAIRRARRHRGKGRS